MLKSIEGIYRDGKIELSELPQNLSAEVRVIVTFLEDAQDTEVEAQDSKEQSEQPPIIYNDLDSLAGTWNEDDAVEFAKNTAIFNQIDEQLWQ